MKQAIGILIIFLWTAISFAQVTVSSEIKEVTLFANQALIKREAKTQVGKGLNEITLEIKAFSVDKDSISAKVFGEGEILSVQYRESFLKEPPQVEIKTLVQKIEELQKSKRKSLDEQEVLNKKQSFLNSIIDFSKTQVPQDMKTNFPGTETLKKMLNFLETNLQSTTEKRRSLDFEIVEIDREIKVLKKELAALRNRSQNVKKIIEITFNSSREQMTGIEASYLVGNATWSPFYKVDVPLSLKEVNLIMFSRIRQITGEDWKNVSLSVSNVTPLRGVGVPSPRSWFLDVVTPREGLKYRAKGAASPSEKEESLKVAAEKRPEAEAQFAEAQAKELPLSFEYRLPNALYIESRKKETLFPLFSKTLRGEFFYYAIPGINPLTFLVCKTGADKELLSGPLNVHFGGRFIGKTFLREKRAGEEFHFNLGVEREIKTKKEKTRDKRKETILGKIERKTIVRELAYKITAENLKDKSIMIKVLDSIPVSRTDRIVVKNVKIDPEPNQKNYQDKEGVLLWEFNLKPREKKEILIEFTVTYPKDMPVMGI